METVLWEFVIGNDTSILFLYTLWLSHVLQVQRSTGDETDILYTNVLLVWLLVYKHVALDLWVELRKSQDHWLKSTIT